MQYQLIILALLVVAVAAVVVAVHQHLMETLNKAVAVAAVLETVQVGQVGQTGVKDILLKMDLQEQVHRSVAVVIPVLLVLKEAVAAEKVVMVAPLGRLDQMVLLLQVIFQRQGRLVVLVVQPLQVHLLTLHG